MARTSIYKTKKRNYIFTTKVLDEGGGGGGTKLEENHRETIDVSTYSGPMVIEPEQGKDGMRKVTATLSNIPDIQENKAQTINVSTYTEPVEITPDPSNDGMAKTTITLSDIPQIQSNKSQTINVSSYSNPVEVTPDSSNDGMAKATIALSNIPQIESNKAATIDVSQYSQPVQITPTSGNDGMAKTTVTLTNIPVPGVTKLYGWTNNIGFSGIAYTTSYPPTNGQTAYYTSTGGQGELRSMRITQVVSDDEFIANGINFERINDYYDITF